MAASREAYFVFLCSPESSTFVFRLTNPQRIQQACDILSGKEKEEVHVTGIIVKSPAPYNPVDLSLRPRINQLFCSGHRSMRRIHRLCAGTH